MKNTNSIFFVLCSLVAACAGEGQQSDVQINSLGQVLVNGELLSVDGLGTPDYGSASEALTVPDGYGIQESTIRACQVTHNAPGDACHIVLDKIVKPRWTGPCTSTELPDFNLCLAFNDAVGLIRPHLQGGGFSVPIGTTGAEVIHDGNLGAGELGQTDDGKWSSSPSSTTNSSVDNQKGVDGKFWYKKGNACDIIIDVGQIGELPSEFRYPIFVRVVEHEISHCAGLPHLKPDDCTHLMNASACVNAPTSLSSAEHVALFNYQP